MEDNSPKFLNREISWLHFNGRVLQEALDGNTPLIERLKFLGIFSNNRDEFFRVRVGTLRRMLNIEKLRYKVKYDPKQILNEIDEIVSQQEKVFTDIYKKLVNELKKENIFLIDETQLTEDQGKYIKRYFFDHLRSQLFPIMLDNIGKETSMVDSSLYLAVDLSSNDPDIEDNQAVIRVPTEIHSRFITFPPQQEKHFIILLDDVIRYCLADIFSVFGYDTFHGYTIKFTRDAELDIDNDVSKSFMATLSESVKKRKKGVPVRFVYEETISSKLLKKLMKKLNISGTDNMRSGGRYHNFKDFMSFPKVGGPHLHYPPMPPLLHNDLPVSESILEVVSKRDIMIHFPYQKFQYIVDLLREASIDPKVTAIKMTFYRAARDSNVMNALINASRNRKEVSVFMELQARFDEEANIFWTNKLIEEGVRIIPTIPGFKVHSKLILIKRLENGEEKGYANVSTGNFNESTGKVYADESLLTANQVIASDVEKVFKLMEMRYKPPAFESLIVSPFSNRDFFIQMLDNEIKNKREGKDAWVLLKLNSIVDKKIIRKIYQASQAGIKIQIIVRGICVLIPGIPGLSENIEAFSIVDKFLEHSRVYVFCNNNDNKYFISSSDWMQRNFDHRIEVTCPILDKNIQNELMTMLKIQLNDNCKARYISVDHPNQYKKKPKGKRIRSQFEIYDYFRNQAEEAPDLK
jgi:polyphosphate kinase